LTYCRADLEELAESVIQHRNAVVLKINELADQSQVQHLLTGMLCEIKEKRFTLDDTITCLKSMSFD